MSTHFLRLESHSMLPEVSADEPRDPDLDLPFLRIMPESERAAYLKRCGQAKTEHERRVAAEDARLESLHRTNEPMSPEEYD